MLSDSNRTHHPDQKRYPSIACKIQWCIPTFSKLAGKSIVVHIIHRFLFRNDVGSIHLDSPYSNIGNVVSSNNAYSYIQHHILINTAISEEKVNRSLNHKLPNPRTVQACADALTMRSRKKRFGSSPTVLLAGARFKGLQAKTYNTIIIKVFDSLKEKIQDRRAKEL
jgi:hypothetical protein